MSLSGHDQRALDLISDRLAGSDPRLAGLLGIFTRLTAGEEMPAAEQIRPGLPAPAFRVRRPQRRPCGRRTPRRGRRVLSRDGAMLLLWLAISVTMIAVAVVLSAGSPGPPCHVAWTMGCAGTAPGVTSHGSP
jgi:hypothetical protein